MGYHIWSMYSQSRKWPFYGLIHTGQYNSKLGVGLGLGGHWRGLARADMRFSILSKKIWMLSIIYTRGRWRGGCKTLWLCWIDPNIFPGPPLGIRDVRAIKTSLINSNKELDIRCCCPTCVLLLPLCPILGSLGDNIGIITSCSFCLYRQPFYMEFGWVSNLAL